MQSLSLNTALRLPAPDVEALVQGRSIVAIPKSFLNVGKVFALYPTDVSGNLLPVEQQYRSSFLTIAKNTISQLHPEGVIIKAWAKCELCQIIDKSESLELLSPLTIWTTEALQEIIAKRSYIFLAYLRVYLLPEQEVMSADSQGQFVGLSKSISVTDNSPILSDIAFSQRRHQLENRISPLHPELEELQSQVAQIAFTNPAAKELDRNIKIFLGWNSYNPAKKLDQHLAWIKDIAALGNRTVEEDTTKKSNYQAGTDFENITRRSLEFLGFKVDEAYKGGAGGLDLFCSQPYPLVGECKAGKIIPGHTVYELDKLGDIHLNNENLAAAVKLIIGPGKATSQLQTVAQKRNISIINPMTLQKLVELQAKYPGSVNLIELKPYLEAGQIDSKIDEYIGKVEKEIKLRSHLVTLIKNYLENTGMDSAGVEALHGAYFGSNPPQPLTTNEMREILIELSSPLTGYLGRKKGSDGSDRFYYLRDLPVE